MEGGPPQIADDPGLVGPEFDEDDGPSTDDDSTAPVLPDARATQTPAGAPRRPGELLAALAASWIPRSSVAPQPAASRGSVFGTVLARPSAVSAPWVTAPGPEAAPDLVDSVPAAETPAAEDVAQITEPTEAEEAGGPDEPTLLDALAALDEAPAWTEGEAGVIEMTTAEVTEVWDLLVTA